MSQAAGLSDSRSPICLGRRGQVATQGGQTTRERPTGFEESLLSLRRERAISWGIARELSRTGAAWRGGADQHRASGRVSRRGRATTRRDRDAAVADRAQATMTAGHRRVPRAALARCDFERAWELGGSLRSTSAGHRCSKRRSRGPRIERDAAFAAVAAMVATMDRAAQAPRGGSAREDAASCGEDATPAPALEIRALGPTEIRLEGAAVEGLWGRPKELLVLLAWHTEGLRREDVGLALWPDASPEKLRNLFHVTLHRLRKCLWVAASGWCARASGTGSPSRFRGSSTRGGSRRRCHRRAARHVARAGARHGRRALAAALQLYRGRVSPGRVGG